MTGSVANESQRQLAEDLASRVEGVRNLINRIVVVEGPTVRPVRRSWQQLARDRGTVTAIRTRLLCHKQFRGLKIDVKCRQEVVTLSGVVGSEEEKATIGEIAEATRGVERVKNNLTVSPKPRRDPLAGLAREVGDEWVERRVELALLMNRHIHVRDLHVEVREEVCILGGTVPTEEQRQLAGAIAGSVYGVQQVRNDIRVEPLPSSIEPIEPAEDAPESSSYR